jgi:hypothetical protein
VDLAAGRAALDAAAWEHALQAFERSLSVEETPEALEGLGYAAWWLDRADVVFDSRERAYRAYRARGDWAAAARMAVWIAWDSVAFRAEEGVANGWLERARRLLDGRPDAPEHASSRHARRSTRCSMKAIPNVLRRWPRKRSVWARRPARSITRWSDARCAVSHA